MGAWRQSAQGVASAGECVVQAEEGKHLSVFVLGLSLPLGLGVGVSSGACSQQRRKGGAGQDRRGGWPPPKLPF